MMRQYDVNWTITAALALLFVISPGQAQAEPPVEQPAQAPSLPPGIGVEDTCGGKPAGRACWLELDNQPGCYVWKSYLKENETATWSGACTDGLAGGTGEIFSVWGREREKNSTDTGQLKQGKRHGQWILHADCSVMEGPYVDGMKHGSWVFQYTSGTVAEGSMVNDKKQGRWVFHNVNGTVVEGHYVDDKRQGRWARHNTDGAVGGGLYVDDVHHGPWIQRFADGSVFEGSYIDGERQGKWIIRWADGTMDEGSFVNGFQKGQWVIRNADGDVVDESNIIDELQSKELPAPDVPTQPEPAADLAPDVSTGETCAGKPVGNACWLELDNQPGCYVWNTFLIVNETATWSGTCADGLAEGTGEFTLSDNGGYCSCDWFSDSETIGRLPDVHDVIFECTIEGNGAKGRHVNGKRQGKWVFNSNDELLAEGGYMDGNRHGRWIFHHIGFQNNILLGLEGDYVQGIRHGQWIEVYFHGMPWAGPYVNGKKHGQWVFHYENSGGEYFMEDHFVEGMRHGQRLLRKPDGSNEVVSSYVNGKAHGRFIRSEEDGTIEITRFLNGEVLD